MSRREQAYPKVSVIISTYDRPKLLDRALESVYLQDFDDFEVIVVDDCSPDPEAVAKVLERWDLMLDSRGIQLWPYRLETNSGYQCFPKNRGIEKAAGDYIAYLDDDNTWNTNHLSSLVAAIESDLSTDMVYSRVNYIVSDDEARNKLKDQFGFVPEGEQGGTEWNPRKIVHANYIDTSTVLHSKGAFWRLVRESGYGWDESLRRFGDWNMFYRWAVFGLTAKLVDKVTVNYYWHSGSLQLNRPPIETPVTFNYQQWLSIRKQVDEDTGYQGSVTTH